MGWDGMKVVGTGEIAGNTSVVVMGNVPCKMVKFKAAADNTGKVYIGIVSALTIPDGTGDISSGYPLGPGEDTGFIPCDNLSEFYRRCDNATDDLIYMALR